MHTKYGVEEQDDLNSEKRGALLNKEIRCPLCQQVVLPPENYGNLLLCPVHGSEPFERKTT